MKYNIHFNTLPEAVIYLSVWVLVYTTQRAVVTMDIITQAILENPTLLKQNYITPRAAVTMDIFTQAILENPTLVQQRDIPDLEMNFT